MSTVILFGGTFDPVHIAHINIAHYAYDFFQHKILISPNQNPPYKHTVSIMHRLNMVKLAFSNKQKFAICDFEARMKHYLYTYEFVEILKKEYDNIFLILGSDSMFSFSTWYGYQSLLDNISILVILRDYTSYNIWLSDLKIKHPIYHSLLKSKVVTCKDKFLSGRSGVFFSSKLRSSISSSIIREHLLKNLSLQDLLVPSVYNYILANKLYSS